MKKLIKKNPKKALKISLVIFLSLMCLNGLIVWLTNSVCLALLIPVLACSQISYVSKWSNYYVSEEIEQKKNELIEQFKNVSFADLSVDVLNEVVANEENEKEEKSE